ncbi:MAG TPA: efflux RND transporter periplasmic adaptor subunit [Pirellulales bacterium]|jgi:Cu(I)/Ag(I) efflux system membrane fusion protein|nr:efflux RND transporter periplasmic adaptor subunit [Pirellulales bacterium]
MENQHDPVPREATEASDNRTTISATRNITASAAPLRGWGRAKFLFKVVEVRLRFIAVLVITFLLIGYWDTVQNYWAKWTRPAAAATRASADTEYFCPMHPHVIRAGLDPNGAIPKCPICGMPLSLRKKGERAQLPPGVLSRVQLSPERIQMAGVQTQAVAYRPLAKEIETVGSVDYDETQLSEIVSRVDGYVEKMYVDKTFVTVQKGDVLAEVYSPELYSTGQELLEAVRRKATDLIASAKDRLRLLGVENQEIETILQSGRAPKNLVLRSPQEGHVIKKKIVAGAHVTAGMTLFEIADLSTVWIEADVFERDAQFLRTGQEIDATVEALPNRVFSGQVSLVHPHVQRATQTNRVRFELKNPGHALRPGMYATVTIKVPLAEIEPYRTQIAESRQRPIGTDDASLIAFQKTCPVTGKKLGSMGSPVKALSAGQTVFLCCPGCVAPFEKSPAKYQAVLEPRPDNGILAVPERAVIDTGKTKIVYLEREPGLFEGVAVEVGPRIGAFYPVSQGLRPGDRVAAAGAFLIDAETRLNPAAAATYSGASGGPKQADSTLPRPDTKATDAQPAASARPRPSSSHPGPTADDLKELAKLPAEDRASALAQKFCPITGEPLGSMGQPFKVELRGQAVFLCCPGCEDDAQKDPDQTLRKAQVLSAESAPARSPDSSAKDARNAPD